MSTRFELRRVEYMPTKLEPGFLYVAEKFKACAHLCACGCGTIVRTPLNRWTLFEASEGPSLEPSIGNWEETCQSHYWIERGEVVWSNTWYKAEIEEGRQREQERLDSLYATVELDWRGRIKEWVNRLREFFRPQ